MGTGRSSGGAERGCSARGDLSAPQSPGTPNSGPRNPGHFRSPRPNGAVAGGDNCKTEATASASPAVPGPAAPTGHHHRLPRLLHGGMPSLGPWRRGLAGTSGDADRRAPPDRPAPPPNAGPARPRPGHAPEQPCGLRRCPAGSAEPHAHRCSQARAWPPIPATKLSEYN